MAATGSKTAVIAAFVGNGLISVTKFFAATLTGSSAMFSEAVHSLVDTGNQVLLLYGMRRAEKPADMTHPFGYGRELYFWAFVVAIMIFATGAGVSIYEGVHKLNDPQPITDAYINYIVLGIAIVFEGGSLYVAFREFRRRKGRAGYFNALRGSKDPALFTVLMEDTAAMLGLIIALVGVYLAEVLDMPALDGIASIAIGVILALIAAFLAYETKALLIGEAAAPDVLLGVRRILGREDGVARVNEVLTMHMGPQDVLLNLSVDFKSALSSDDVETAITGLETQIKGDFPQITRVFIEAQSVRAHRTTADKTGEA